MSLTALHVGIKWATRSHSQKSGTVKEQGYSARYCGNVPEIVSPPSPISPSLFLNFCQSFLHHSSLLSD